MYLSFSEHVEYDTISIYYLYKLLFIVEKV